MSGTGGAGEGKTMQNVKEVKVAQGCEQVFFGQQNQVLPVN